MPSISAPAARAALTATGTQTGILAVASTTPFHVGAEAWVSDDLGNSQRVIITRILSATTLQARPVPEANQQTVRQLSGAAGGDLSAYAGPATQASKDFGTVGAGNFDSVLEAVVEGYAGNAITVELVGDSGLGAGVDIDVVGSVVTIHYESGVSTVGDIETAIAALAGADDIIDVKTAGTGATVLTAPADDSGPTALAGGMAAWISMPAQVVRVEVSYTKAPNLG